MKNITQSVLDFWLGERNSDGSYNQQRFWFKSSDDFDTEIREKFEHVHRDIVSGQFNETAQDADDYLAIIIVLDQFSRNMFRGQAKAFETDALALDWAQRAIAKGYDLALAAPVPRMFCYLPFEHSEDMAVQHESVRLFATLEDADLEKYAVAHLKVIEEFGRFPHRNGVLGRITTKDEDVYLSKPGAGF